MLLGSFDQVPKSVGSFLAVDRKFLNEFKLMEYRASFPTFLR
jgi:hypothetical protein